MEFSFSANASLEDPPRPELGYIFDECEVVASLTIHCEADRWGIYPMVVDVEGLEFHAYDPLESLKVRFLMPDDHVAALKQAIKDKVENEWHRFEEKAAEHLQGELDCAEEQRYESWRDGF